MYPEYSVLRIPYTFHWGKQPSMPGSGLFASSAIAKFPGRSILVSMKPIDPTAIGVPWHRQGMNALPAGGPCPLSFYMRCQFPKTSLRTLQVVSVSSNVFIARSQQEDRMQSQDKLQARRMEYEKQCVTQTRILSIFLRICEFVGRLT